MYFNITVPQPELLQACHEEADTPIVLHVAGISVKNIIVRASDTNVLVILVGVFSALKIWLFIILSWIMK